MLRTVIGVASAAQKETIAGRLARPLSLAQHAPTHSNRHKRRGRRRRSIATIGDLGICGFGTSCRTHLKINPLHSQSYIPSFFHNSRPDFLPSQIPAPNSNSAKPSEASSSIAQPPQHVRRHVPAPQSSLKLPGLDVTPQIFHWLWHGVSKGSADETWQAFVPVFRSALLQEGDSVPIPTQLFDAVFWTTVSGNGENLTHQLELFNRVRLLSEYATSQGIELTQMQVRRLAYLFITAWEQHDLQGNVFSPLHFASVLLPYISILDDRLTSRLLSRFATNALFKEACEMLRLRAQGGVATGVRRCEEWDVDENISDDPKASSNLHPLSKLDSSSWEHSIEACVREHERRGVEPSAARKLGTLALQYCKDIAQRRKVVRAFLELCTRKEELVELLPPALRNLHATAEASPKACREAVEEIRKSLLSRGTGTFDWRNSLVVMLTTVLAKRGDFRPARQILLAEEQGVFLDGMQVEVNELFGDCVVYASRRALSESDKHKALNNVRIALSFFCHCEWRSVKMDRVVHRLLIRAFARLIRSRAEREALLPASEWTSLLRRLTISILIHDTDLDTLHSPGQGDISLLLRQHIALRDYAFAKRILIVNRLRFSEYGISMLPSHDFHWLLGAAIDNERHMTFASQLLHFFLWSEWSESKPPHLDPTLLVRYIRRLAGTRRSQVLASLQQDLLGGTASKVQQVRHPGAMRRLITLVMSIQNERQDFMMQFVVDIFNVCSSRLETKHLAGPFAIALEMTAQRRTGTKSSNMAMLLTSFEEFRARALKEREAIFDDRKTLRQLRQAYLAALQISVWEAGFQRSSQGRNDTTNGPNFALATSKMLLEELKSVWQLSKTESSALCALEIDIGLVEGHVDHARHLFVEQLQKGSTADSRRLPAASASKLALAMACKERFEDASDILALYHRHCTGVRPAEAQLLEIASLTLLCMQPDMADLAVQRAITLIRCGVLDLPNDTDIQRRVLEVTHILPLAFETSQKLRRLQRTGQSSASLAQKPEKPVLWRTTHVVLGDWKGQMQKMRDRLQRWLIDGVPQSDGEETRTNMAEAKSGVGKDTAVERLPMPVEESERALKGQDSDEADWDPEEDRRRQHAFEALASGQRWCPRW